MNISQFELQLSLGSGHLPTRTYLGSLFFISNVFSLSIFYNLRIAEQQQ